MEREQKQQIHGSAEPGSLPTAAASAQAGVVSPCCQHSWRCSLLPSPLGEEGLGRWLWAGMRVVMSGC